MKTKQGLNRLLAICALLHVAMLSYATIAYPGLVEFKQPNGNIVKVTMRGSETLKWAETEDGYTLMYDSIGNLVYAELDAMGDLVPSNVIATDMDFRPAEVEMRLMATPKHLAYSQRQMAMAEQVQQARSRQMAQMASSGAPAVGTRKMLLILVDFPDYPFQKTKEDFELLMNQLNYTDDGRYGSVRDFYRENSFGQLDLIHDVVGVYRLQYERAYYGGNNGYSNDNDPRQMALEAVTMAAADVNFADYDNDGDGTVDGVHIIYAGPGEEAGGGSDCIWAHSWTVSATVDGVRTYRYSCSPEIRGSGGSQMTHIGVICHEIGHVLGAMDFYDTNYSTGGQYPGTGQWDLMASGNWNGNGACPAHFNPYTKIYDYGWATPADGNQAASFTLGAKSKEGFVRIDTQTDGEFFLLEYRAKSGFDLCAPYHGLMVYRASDGLSRMSANTLNAYHKQQFYPLVANAPNEIPTSVVSTYGSVNTSTAPFPGSLGVDELTDFTTPSMKSWIGVNTEFPITSIKEDVSGESVTFDIAGGIEGGAYGFKVTDSDTLSITFGWKTPASETVVLAFSKEPTFGVPENRAYTAGETITGGGEVIYVGKDLTFKHSGLEQQEEYYYKLFTLRADGTYTAGRQLKAETAVGVIRKFPYTEDFSSMVLPSTWNQEYLIANKDWTVENFFETGNWKLMFNLWETRVPHQRTRIVMPQMDFSGHKYAILSLDYLNYLQTLDIVYRVSPTDTWHNIKTIQSQHPGNVGSLQEVKDNEQHIDIELPNISGYYEIAFVADFPKYNGSNKEVISIDNIKIQTDYPLFVPTLRPLSIGSTSAEIPVTVFNGLDSYVEKGIQWSTDKSIWNTVKAATTAVTHVTGLPKGGTVYYRGYAIGESGTIIYGEVLSLVTLSFSNGSGTADDPFLLENNTDWDNLRKYVNAGNDCQGIHFALSSSFTLTSTSQITGTFNGTIDGKGKTITITATTFKGLFARIGKKGLLKNISIHIDALEASSGAIYCGVNLGTIANCKTYIGTITASSSSSSECSGICRNNYGLIYKCEAEMYGGGDMFNGGGICYYNCSGSVVGCSFKGKLASNNNGDIAGIVGVNYQDAKFGKDVCGLISDCVNYGTMEIFLNDEGKAWWVGAGGICCSNYGWIQRCVNKGTIIAANGDNSVNSGGIVSSNQYGTIVDCYNMGKITTSNNSSNARHVGVGGVAGYGYLSSIRNAFSLKNITIDGTKTASLNGVIGNNNQTEIENCYYWGSDTENYATRCEYADLCSEEMIRKLNNNGANDVWVLMDGRPALKWEQTGVVMAQDLIFDMDATRAGLSWIVLGDNVVSSGLEWRKKGAVAWTREQGVCNQPSSVELTGLKPVTIYETRVYAITSTGETLTTPIETFATLFESKGTKDDPHLIADYNQLLVFNEMIAHSVILGHQIVRLANDIDLKGEQGILWEPIKSKYRECSFEGEFDGNGHVLSHMYIDTKKCYAGLFGLFRGYIHDLTIVNSEIKCNTAATTNGYYAGVGGFVGSSIWYSAVYPYIAQRCGFEGRIIGGNAIGGIIGAVATVDAVNDCYANVDIAYTQSIKSYSRKTGVGGIVGEGNAQNSYSTGTITINNTFGVSYGPVAGLYYNASNPNVNSYYDVVCNKSYTNSSDDISMTVAEMTSDAFLNSLTADVWTRADHLNEGYPVFASRAASRVTTSDAGHSANGDVEISAIYMAGADMEYQTHGFQWYSKMGDAMNIIETVIEDADDSYVLTIPNQQVSDEGVNYRAFAAQEGDSIFGEWKSFIPTFRSPQLLISAITVVDRNTATLEYAITEGSEDVVYTFEYAGAYEPDSVVSLPVDEALTKFSVANIKKMQEYKGVLVAATDAGIRVESEPFAWSQRTATAHALTYLIGDSVAVVHYYEPGDVIDAVVVKDVFGLEFSGWEGLPATMPDNDLTVSGEYVVQYIAFADATVESICLTNWDANDDGKLSLEEAAAVTDLGTVFKYNSKIKTFDELKYFTGLTKIGSNTFFYCTSLEFVSFPNTVVTIESYVFYNCSNLKSLVIPASVTSFGNSGSYNYCTKLAEIVVEEGNPVYDSRDNCNAVIQKSNNTLVLGCMNTVIPNTVKEIGDYAFDNCYGLLKIEVPESVTKINSYGFSTCIEATEVNLPNSLEYIGKSAFYDCRKLQSLYIPTNVSTITSGSFRKCNSLQSIAVAEDNATYDSRDNCNGIIETAANRLVFGNEHTTIPSSVAIIGNDAFYDCVNLTAINLPNSVTTIEGNAFQNCTGLTSVEIPSSIVSIGNSVFSGCTGLTSIDLPATITSLGNSVFSGCTGLTSIDLPATITSLGIYVFLNCTGLTSIDLPASITSIGNYTFQGCKGLTSIELPATITSIGKYAFDNCSSLTHIKVHWETPLAITSDNNIFRNVDISSVTLYVPVGTKALYEAAEVWKDFGTIEEFTSESDYTLGDPNNDGYIDVADLAAQVQFILGTAGSNLLLAAADMDASGVVEVNDYVALVNVILKQSSVSTRSAAGTSELDQLLQLAPVVVNEDGQGELWITLTAEQRQMSGFQLDLTLPEGVTIADEGITIGSRKHNAWCEPMGANGYRIVCASLSNAAFASDTVMCVKLQTADMKQGSYELTATGIVLSDTEAKRYESQAIRERVEVEDQDDGLQLSVNGDVLTLVAHGDQQVLIALPNGMMVDSFELVDGAMTTRVLPRGVYIVNGKKVVL